MRIFFFLLFMLSATLVRSQDTVSLFDCHRWAEEYSPRAADREIIARMEALKNNQAGTGLLPSLHLNGKATYQSDVVTFSPEGLPVPIEFPEVPNDQYGINLDVNQVLYDGGITRRRKSFEQSSAEADMQEVEVDLFAIKEKINQLFFHVLLLQERKRSLEIQRDQLSGRKKVMESAMDQGAALEADINIIRVAILRVEQSLLEVEAGITSMVGALNVLCGMNIREGSILQIPDVQLREGDVNNRPEFALFELKEASLEAGKELASRKRMPQLYAFGQTGYGKPGYNILSDKWDFYYMVGAGLHWNLWDWNSTARERQLIQQQQMLLRNREESFRQNLESRCVQEMAMAERYRKSMELERSVLELQKGITSRAAAQLASGTITVTEYVDELNKESLSRINLASQRVKWAESIVNYLTLNGIL